MKTIIYDFINEYISNCEKENLSNIRLKSICDVEHTSYLNNISELLLEIKEEDKLAYKNLIKLDEDGVLYEYLFTLKKYYERKNELQYSTSKIARKIDVPDLTVQRFENLHNLINLCTLLKALKMLELNIKL